MTADKQILEQLHVALAQELLDIIKNGVPVFDREGNQVDTRKASAAELGAAISFLKANNITADMDHNDDLKDLREALEARRKKRGPVLEGINLQ